MKKNVLQNEKEINDSMNNIKQLDSILNQLSEYYSDLRNESISRENIFESLYLVLKNKYDWEHLSDFWSLNTDYQKAQDILSDFDFRIVKNKIETSREIIPNDLLMNYKVQVKSKGLIWVIHKYDADPFPSNPHAHQIVSGLKLDLSNGKCYKKKKFVYKIKKKDLLLIRKQVDKKIELPAIQI